MYFYDGVWRVIGRDAVTCAFICVVIGAELWSRWKAKDGKGLLKSGRLLMCALALCYFLGNSAYLWHGIETEDVVSFVGEYESSRSARNRPGRKHTFVADNGARYSAYLQRKPLYNQLGSIGFREGKEYRITYHRRSGIIVGIEELDR